jgi:hypothetical protein
MTRRSRYCPQQRQRIFPLTSVSRPALGPTQPPVQWVPRVLSPGLKRGRVVTLITHPHLVPRSRMSRSYTSSPPSPSMVCSGTALALGNLFECRPSFRPSRLTFSWLHSLSPGECRNSTLKQATPTPFEVFIKSQSITTFHLS